jgi:hypothetical protein
METVFSGRSCEAPAALLSLCQPEKKPMIPAAAGATPLGIFLLADGYLKLARKGAEEKSVFIDNASTLLAFHAAELYLKTYMRARGETIASLRKTWPQLRRAEHACSGAWIVDEGQRPASCRGVDLKAGYVGARYLVCPGDGFFRPAQAIGFASSLPRTVSAALNFDKKGNPKSGVWLGPPPPDYPKVKNENGARRGATFVVSSK